MTEKLLEFFKRRPDIQQKFNFDGTFKEYTFEIGKSLIKNTEFSDLRENILIETKRTLSEYISLDVLENQLSDFPLISYADHHGLLNYKLLYNSNILYYLIVRELKLPYIVVFASGNVPMVNISLPRGFYFKKEKFNFFGEKQSKQPICLFKNKLQPDSRIGIDSFLTSYDKKSLTNEERTFIEFLFFDCLEIEKAGELYNSFSEQLTFLNHKIWKYYFHKSKRDSIQNIIYLQSNNIILSSLVNEIKKKDSLISSILFDPKVRRIFLNNFDGINCCWGENMGSQLFWGIIRRKNKTRLTSLHVDDHTNSLIGENFELKLERNSVIDALMEEKILQTSFFDLLIVTFIEGFLALGGMNQLEYLPQMQKAHIKSLDGIGMKDMAEKFKIPVAHGLICGMYPFDFDSGIDLIWHYNSKNGKFNGNMDGGLTQEDLDKVLNMSFTELLATGIDQTLQMF